MPRAHPFMRAVVAKRRNNLALPATLSIGCDCTPAEQKFINELIQAACIAPPVQQEFSYKLKIAITAYRVRELAHQQERPAAIVAALKPVVKAAMALQCESTARGKRSLFTRLAELP